MARMHSRKKGKSGSKKPSKKAVHSWIRYKPKEVELLIIKFAKEGMTPSQIGVHLRDTYGIPDVKSITKKSILTILTAKKLNKKIPENLGSLIQRAIVLQKHLEANRKDLVAKRGLVLTESKIQRLVKYYKKTDVLPVEWKYDRKNVNLLLE